MIDNLAVFINHTTLSAGLSTLNGQFSTNYPVLMAGSLLAMLPMVILYLILQKRKPQRNFQPSAQSVLYPRRKRNYGKEWRLLWNLIFVQREFLV